MDVCCTDSAFCADASSERYDGRCDAGTKRPYGRATQYQQQANMFGKRKTEIATSEENEGGVRTCLASCTRTHYKYGNR